MRASGLHLLLLLLVGPFLLPGCTSGTTPPPADNATFVGTATCATCHADVAETFAQTNHARAVSRFEQATAPEALPSPEVYDPNTRLTYQAFARNDTLFQRELRRAPDGTVLHERVEPAAYVIGSGNATRSYLMRTNGYVTEMPLTWYVHRAQWDLSPGYRDANDRFDRQISLECITCHTAPVQHSAFTQNHYTDVPLGISCENCHGPGSTHVALRESGEGPAPGAPDASIVNPARLDRGAQLSTCQQCHLAGVTVFAPGESAPTYTAGRPLAAHRTVYVPAAQLTDPDWVGIDSHPVRLARSACYQASAMTCSTCHDPHTPPALQPADAFNTACQSCHSGNAHELACARPNTTAAQAATGDCVSCHMQQGGTTDVPHVRFTDHWIRRDPGPALDPGEGRPVIDDTEAVQLVALQEEGRSAYVIAARTQETPQTDIEAAAAFFHFYETMHAHPAYLSTVVERGRRGLQGGGDHVEGRIALARALAEQDALDEALDVLQKARAAYPDEAWVWFWQGALLDEAGQPDAAIAPLQQAIALQPLFIEAQVQLADAFVRAGRTADAIGQLEAVVRTDPAHQPNAWFNLGVLRLQSGAPGATEAFERAIYLDPNHAAAHVQLGSLALRDQRLADAEYAFLQAIDAAPEDPAPYGSLGLVMLQRGRPDAARALFETVLRLDPHNEHARSLLVSLGG